MPKKKLGDKVGKEGERKQQLWILQGAPTIALIGTVILASLLVYSVKFKEVM